MQTWKIYAGRPIVPEDVPADLFNHLQSAYKIYKSDFLGVRFSYMGVQCFKFEDLFPESNLLINLNQSVLGTLLAMVILISWPTESMNVISFRGCRLNEKK